MVGRCCLACLVLGVTACGSSEADVDNGSPSFRVAHIEQRVGLREREIWLLVVDDADTPAANAMREDVAAAIRLPEGGPYAGRSSACPGDPEDPSHADPIDTRVIVAHPSQNDALRLVTPAEVPELARIGERDDLEPHERWLTSVRNELLRTPATAETRGYAPFDTIASTLSLLAERRAPRSAEEQQQLDALLTTRPLFVRIFFGTTRDDQSPGAIPSYDLLTYNGIATHVEPEETFFFELRLLVATETGSYLDRET
ncbi:MAG TPA: hypothetical protein VIV60_29585, partial [Polyangiaceae bacterium]